MQGLSQSRQAHASSFGTPSIAWSERETVALGADSDLRVVGERGLAVGVGKRLLTLARMGDRAAHQRNGAGAAGDGLVIDADRLVVAAEAKQRHAEAVEIGRHIGLELERRVALVERTVEQDAGGRF